MFQQSIACLAFGAAAFLLSGCETMPTAAAPTAPAPAKSAAKPDDKSPCYYRTGSNYCYRDSVPGDSSTMSQDQMRRAVEESNMNNMPRRN